jgi:hypothetical protein
VCALPQQSNGTFTDVTAASGITATHWGSSAVWFDYDNDGKLDLFVAEFADYSNLKISTAAESYGGKAIAGEVQEGGDYCAPQYLNAAPSHLYRNLGRGKFADVSDATRISSRPGKAWGAVATEDLMRFVDHGEIEGRDGAERRRASLATGKFPAHEIHAWG